ncbi:MAG: hypothetical protein ABIP67_17125 [Burkholderiales bacterium]
MQSELSRADYEKLLVRCQTLPPHQGNYAVQTFLSNVVLTVLDYQLHNTIVKKAHERFVRAHSNYIQDINQLAAFLDRYPNDKQGNTDAAITLWGYKHWTRLEQLRGLVAHFIRIGVVDSDTLKNWATTATFKGDFKGKVKGLGPAIFQWLIMRAGVETIKPDVHIMNFVSSAIGHSPSFDATISVLISVAKEIGKTPRELDLAIWELQRGAPGQI